VNLSGSPLARGALVAAAIVALLGCATPLGRHGSDRLRDLGDIPIVGGGFGGLVIFGSGGGIEAGVKVTELVVPVVGASEMHEFEISNSQLTLQFERTLGFPISPIYSLLTGHTPRPPVAARQSPRGFLTMTARQCDTEFEPRYAQSNVVDIPASLRGEASTDMVLGSAGHEGLNSFWLITPWLDCRRPFLERLDVQGEATVFILSVKLGISFGQIVDLLAGLVALDPLGDDGRGYSGEELTPAQSFSLQRQRMRASVFGEAEED
jgi:hypothetical protein